MKTRQKIGVLGGGQLGKMLCEAGLPWHADIHVLDRDISYPAGPYTAHFTEGDFQSYDDVIRFGQDKDVITIEIESVNTKALFDLEKSGVKVYPQPHLIELIQDKGLQKQFYTRHGFPTSAYTLKAAEEISADMAVSYPFVQKLRRGGYDGRGVQIVRSSDQLILNEASVFEDLIDIEKELSVIVARDTSGHIVSYDVVEMVFDPVGNLVDHLISPADIDPDIASKADHLARGLIEKLDMIGLLAVEMFLTKTGEILINEVAPRPHNSGHHTIKSTDCSQYEQLLRCLLEAPLIEGRGHTAAMMVNILGAPEGRGVPIYNGIDKVMATPGIHLYLYGKAESRPFRKMGHFTITGEDRRTLMKKADIIKQNFSVSCE